MKIKKGDKVKVLTGKDKGSVGLVIRALPKVGKVVIEGVAITKRHLKGLRGKTGRIVERPRAIDVSNVALLESGKNKK